jgi:hypothetical protein
VFYERHYSEEDLYRRLINPSGLRLRRIEYVGERILTGSELEIADLPAFMGPLEPLISRLVHVRAPDWRELKKPLCAFMVLRKEGPHAG